jgi:hypothetical protein
MSEKIYIYNYIYLLWFEITFLRWINLIFFLDFNRIHYLIKESPLSTLALPYPTADFLFVLDCFL